MEDGQSAGQLLRSRVFPLTEGLGGLVYDDVVGFVQAVL